jgi:hypothetical protein
VWSLEERLLLSAEDYWYLKDNWKEPVLALWGSNAKFTNKVLAHISCQKLVARDEDNYHTGVEGDRWHCTLRKSHRGPCVCNIPGHMKVVESGYVL